ncbi:sushi, von Willebrand factor type A, EGF and pentraxin domain-containing protein 1-like [Ruditapes philippinarum]|uniref:sushi, von Willebrand factor type A, EGF and pentraxin domain-containing protein 1-like n=1 Tax=Ruditapes philippinarum TaxID=129788 RepID=UPI00295A687A|nr:sushi, von Willebrand factor type A, EGF and pentraxin domain-containing protein 1-like [Ruditapes philippinarum]
MFVIQIVVVGLLLRIVNAGFCKVSYDCQVTCTRTRSSYYSCGFLWLGRCTRYSRGYTRCPGICYKDECCSGYMGTNCNIPLCDGSTTCPNGGTCISPDKCSCPTGFSPPFCADTNECAGPSHGCEHECRNTDGSYTCTCRGGYVRNPDLKTCTEDCGHPGNIKDGTVSLTSTLLGASARYSCNQGYRMASGDEVRQCQSDFSWSGREPTCIFSNYCESLPCLNGATCVNLLGGFWCKCAHGWKGGKCENDIAPPMVTGCHEDIHVNATEQTIEYSWTEPQFSDSRGSALDIVSNYHTPEFTFPWGDFTVQYVATKISNGLRTECSFKIKVRPTPCEPLNVPINGARLCNGWQTGYGRFCMIMCQQNFTIGPSFSYSMWYVCGASGNWIAASPVPDCQVPVDSENEGLFYHPEYAGYVFTPSCQDQVTKSTLQNLYIEYLNGTSGFSSFCTTYGNECVKENVDVQC